MYLLRFKQCLNQALNQVKSHVVSLLKNATSQVLANKVKDIKYIPNVIIMFKPFAPEPVSCTSKIVCH